jgi:hypothetical protein
LCAMERGDFDLFVASAGVGDTAGLLRAFGEAQFVRR